jgi:recombination protein RecR
MAQNQNDPIRRLISHLARLPGVGEKTATRLAFYILGAPNDYVCSLAEALTDVTNEVRLCSTCCNYTQRDPCAICTDPRRDASTVCVVARTQDLLAIERASAYRGRYHVLHGVLSPLDGIGPEDLKVSELLRQLQGSEVEEVILAISPSVDGEATAVYLAGLLKPLDVTVSRIASGVPIGGELEYADGVTLGRALEDRREL